MSSDYSGSKDDVYEPSGQSKSKSISSNYNESEGYVDEESESNKRKVMLGRLSMTIDSKEAHHWKKTRSCCLSSKQQASPPLLFAISLKNPCMQEWIGWMESLDAWDCCGVTCRD
ncbi:hypothetical protein E2562_017872 [Oryza meyeriana var. granulata]|uniref:Uncharacterized protein n=1 Tax=Oryza meyeriana var. granulata TaxID=110450 RepID=A0A6G1DXU9_9ORYZ|nr:hypothetical protein E2562_017872 [Oryza meyeriana var. granulata]